MIANGLMAFTAEIDADYVTRYQQWHNCEHIPERVSIPGFLTGRRYRALDDRPRFLMFYETQSSQVFTSQPYLAALNAPTDWTREALTHFRNPRRTVYSLVASAGEAPFLAAPYAWTMRFNLGDVDAEARLPAWAEQIGNAKGVTRARIWKSDEAGSNITTSERAIYSGGPDKQVFLALVELERPPEHSDDPFDAIGSAAAVSPLDAEREAFWLEISHDRSIRGGV